MLWEFIKQLNRDGHTIILTTHYLEEAENFCSRIGIMKNGELVTLKKNKDLLSLGGKPKFNVILKALSSLPKEVWLEDIKKDFPFEEAQFDFVTELLQKDEKKVKVSIQISYQNFEYVTQCMEKIEKLSLAKNLTIESFYTEQPSLEEVFLKINDGKIQS